MMTRVGEVTVVRVGWEGVGSEYHGIYNSYISVPCSSMRISKFAADDDRRPPSSSDAGQSRTAEQNDSPTAISQRVPREFGVLNIAVSLPAHAFKATNCGCWMCWRQHKRGNCLKGARRGGEVSGVCPSSISHLHASRCCSAWFMCMYQVDYQSPY